MNLQWHVGESPEPGGGGVPTWLTRGFVVVFVAGPDPETEPEVRG